MVAIRCWVDNRKALLHCQTSDFRWNGNLCLGLAVLMVRTCEILRKIMHQFFQLLKKKKTVFHISAYILNYFFPDTTVHYFICMIRNGAHVVLTQMMSTHDAMVRDSLDFPNLIKLKDIKQNFRFDLEIYGMVNTYIWSIARFRTNGFWREILCIQTTVHRFQNASDVFCPVLFLVCHPGGWAK